MKRAAKICGMLLVAVLVLQLIPQTAQAKTVNSLNQLSSLELPISELSIGDSDRIEETTSDGCLTCYVQAYRESEDQYIISAGFEWLKMPSKMETDVFELTHSPNMVQVESAKDVCYQYAYDINRSYFGYGDPVCIQTVEIDRPTTMCIGFGGTVISQNLLEGIDYSLFNSTVNYYYVSHPRGFLQYTLTTGTPGYSATSVSAAYCR
ncbi:MAG: hypothetical protein LUG13_07115 [Oscillospiraceae bacterium]|nr:hypothetical protein [Oscillospiraceae bacterium]